MIIFDYKAKDFKEIKSDNNKKKYFIRIEKEFIEVSKDVYRVYKADYMKTYRFLKRKEQYPHINYEDGLTIDKNIQNLDMNKYYIKQINKKESLHNLFEAMKHLDKEQYFIIYSLFFKGETETSVARKLNVTQQTLNWRKKKILLFLKNILLKS